MIAPADRNSVSTTSCTGVLGRGWARRPDSVDLTMEIGAHLGPPTTGRERLLALPLPHADFATGLLATDLTGWAVSDGGAGLLGRRSAIHGAILRRFATFRTAHAIAAVTWRRRCTEGIVIAAAIVELFARRIALARAAGQGLAAQALAGVG